VREVLAARNRLDAAILGFNRHSILAERYRRGVETFQAAKASFQTGALQREDWREARASAALHRANVRATVQTYVHCLRDEGIAPEVALIAVKDRLHLSASRERPGPPAFDAASLGRDAADWAIAAYYDVA
jgi:hypothetical protein